MRKLTFILAVLFQTISSCTAEYERTIEGNWFADSLTESGKSLEVDGDIVQFEFKSNNEYVFHGTLNAHEVGSFRIQQNYLYTKDRLKNTPEKAVRLDRLTVDSLVLTMNDRGKERVLTLLRLQTEPDTVILPAESQNK